MVGKRRGSGARCGFQMRDEAVSLMSFDLAWPLILRFGNGLSAVRPELFRLSATFCGSERLQRTSPENSLPLRANA